MGFVTYGLGHDIPSYPVSSFPLTRVYVGIQRYISVLVGSRGISGSIAIFL